MLQNFQEHINKNFPFLKDKKLLIAISGGLDSVVLSHLFYKLNYTIYLAHCNFKLRGTESNLDEDFIKKNFQKTSNQIFTIKFNTSNFAKENKISTQVAARELRYNWFQELIKKHQLDYILTAHHADDNLETFLINLTRGSGLEGFTGIPAINQNIIRPLLPFSRKEIFAYAKLHNLKWREDESNSETKYIRNKIRLEIVPKLKEINPSLLNSFQNSIHFLQESKQIIDDKIDEVRNKVLTQKDDVITIDIEKINQLSNPKAYLFHLLKEYHFTEWNDVSNLLLAQNGKQILSKTHRLIKDRTSLILISRNSTVATKKFFIPENKKSINEPFPLSFIEKDSTFSTKTSEIVLDKDLLNFPLILRKWEKGDYFYPTGMRGKKKVSKFFKDEKFSLLDKEKTWILANNNNDVIWIINYRKDRRFVAKENTINKLKLITT